MWEARGGNLLARHQAERVRKMSSHYGDLGQESFDKRDPLRTVPDSPATSKSGSWSIRMLKPLRTGYSPSITTIRVQRGTRFIRCPYS
jgi:hypothetical protein